MRPDACSMGGRTLIVTASDGDADGGADFAASAKNYACMARVTAVLLTPAPTPKIYCIIAQADVMAIHSGGSSPASSELQAKKQKTGDGQAAQQGMSTPQTGSAHMHSTHSVRACTHLPPLTLKVAGVDTHTHTHTRSAHTNTRTHSHRSDRRRSVVERRG
jgi:hypothetical protein